MVKVFNRNSKGHSLKYLQNLYAQCFWFYLVIFLRMTCQTMLHSLRWHDKVHQSKNASSLIVQTLLLFN